MADADLGGGGGGAGGVEAGVRGESLAHMLPYTMLLTNAAVLSALVALPCSLGRLTLTHLAELQMVRFLHPFPQLSLWHWCALRAASLRRGALSSQSYPSRFRRSLGLWCRTTWEDSSHNNTTVPVDIYRQSPDACVGNALPARE